MTFIIEILRALLFYFSLGVSFWLCSQVCDKRMTWHAIYLWGPFAFVQNPAKLRKYVKKMLKK